MSAKKTTKRKPARVVKKTRKPVGRKPARAVRLVRKPLLPCRCLDKANELLSKQGAELVLSLTRDGHARAVVATQKQLGSHKPLIHLVANFCPICGREYPPLPSKQGV